MTLVQTEPKKIYIRVDEELKYLCFTANTAGSTVKLQKNGSPTTVTLETSTDGSTRTPYTIGNTITLSNIGDRVYWRNTSTTDTGFNTGSSNYYNFVMTGSIDASGDVNYLLNKNSTNVVSANCYYNLFVNNTAIRTAPELPATTLGTYCYAQMFQSCTNLQTAPKLPATTTAYGCYDWMFGYCSNLEMLPRLPAVGTLSTRCYNSMFSSCSKIKISATQTGEYQTEYRIPITGTGTDASGALTNMFTSTGGTFKSTPTINTTYYTSNTLV